MEWCLVCGHSHQKFLGITLTHAVCLVLDISVIRQTMLVKSNVKMVLKLLQLLLIQLSLARPLLARSQSRLERSNPHSPVVINSVSMISTEMRRHDMGLAIILICLIEPIISLCCM
jgi:hypothetical protein